tara:strand:- start:676 stop:951 length:276 start_codon:yes stop_codon:yes gene_type:complete
MKKSEKSPLLFGKTVVEYIYKMKKAEKKMDMKMYVEMLARMTATERVQFVEMLCEKWPHLATEISNSIEVTLMDNVFLENEKKVQAARAVV